MDDHDRLEMDGYVRDVADEYNRLRRAKSGQEHAAREQLIATLALIQSKKVDPQVLAARVQAKLDSEARRRLVVLIGGAVLVVLAVLGLCVWFVVQQGWEL